ncbi:hypothetical protein OG21DRAFT_1528399, partial [Imleria badia]
FTAPSQQQLAPENITADVYITPRAFHAAPQKTSEAIAVLVQGFCQEMALPHLHEFTKSCDVEGIGPIPPPSHAPSITLESPPFLPPAATDRTRIWCSAQPYVGEHSSSATRAKAQASGGSKNDMKVCQRRNAECFSVNEVAKALKEVTSAESGIRSVAEPATLNLRPIVSLGPNTDAVLDRFGMSDQVIPRLRELVVTVCSSRWEVMLRNSPWNLDYEQAANLQKALHADFGMNMPLVKTSSFGICKMILILLLVLLVVKIFRLAPIEQD